MLRSNLNILLGMLLLVSLAPGASLAEEQQGFTISPMIGLTGFEDGIEEDPHWSLGLGYQFNNPWAVEFVYSNADADDDRTGANLDFTRWHLDGLYHLDTIGGYRPYLTFGAGRAEYDFSPGMRDTDTLLNVGIGVKYEFAENTSVRSEIKFLDGNDIDSAEYAFSFGLHHVFAANTRSKTIVKPKMTNTDGDNDGVLDSFDQCLTTPTGQAVNDQGCPRDSDQDGIADYKDSCPGTSDPMAKVDSNGCYIMISETVTIELDVEFDFDSALSRPEHKNEVSRINKFMRSYPLTNVVIEGHTDSKGNSEYNQSLSQRRASSIADMLVENFGIDRRRVSAKGYGEERPIADNSTNEGRQKNRRVSGRIDAIVEKLQEKN